MVFNYAMAIITKNIDVVVKFPLNFDEIEKALKIQGIEPLRYAIVKVDNNTLTVNVTFQNL